MKRLFMKQDLIRSLLLIVGLVYYGTPALASDCDFEVNNMCYNFIEGKPNEVAVTYRWYEGGRYGDGYSAHYTGSVTVPAMVSYNGTSYRVTAVGNSAFRECSVTSVSLPSTITSIGSNAFCDCASLTSITLPQGVTFIGAGAFNGCIYLNSVNMPSGVTDIGASAFYDCRNLYTINFPSKLKTIGADAFTNTGWYNSQADGLLYIGTILYKYKGTMPEGSSIRLNWGTTSIAGSAFSGCTGLVTMDIPESVTSIGSYAFQNCSSLIDINIPEVVTIIDNYVFSGCSSLPSISLPDAVTDIGSYAFQGCSNLKSITIPQNVKAVGATPFRSSGLTEVNILCPNVNSGMFQYLGSVQRLTLGEAVESIGVSAFIGCSNLSTIVFNDKLSSIGSSALDNTAWLENQPNGLVLAGKVAYKYKGTMPSGTECVLPEGTKGIAAFAFDGCNGLAAITIPSSVNNIGQAAFQGCCALSSIVIPEGVTKIENSTFQNCTSLSSVSLPSSVSEIAEYVFSNCVNLTSITLPKSLTTIGNNAFQDCALNEVIAKMQEPATLGFQVFSFYSSYSYSSYVGTATLRVPDGCKAAYEAAAVWKDFKEIIEMEPEPEEDTDISALDNVIYINKVEGFVGQQKTLSLKMKNTVGVQTVQFDLYLPDGVTVAKDGDGFDLIELSTERTTARKMDSFSSRQTADGAYRVLINSSGGYTFDGEDGEIARVTVNIAADMAEGDYPLILKGIVLVNKSSEGFETEYVKATLTVSDYSPGDVNGDGKVNAIDLNAIVNYILESRTFPFSFVEKAADLNGDLKVNAIDVNMVTNMILGSAAPKNVKAQTPICVGVLQER